MASSDRDVPSRLGEAGRASTTASTPTTNGTPRTTESSDYIIKCGDQIFPVHRAIVCAQARFFEAAIDGRFLEAASQTVTLEEDEPEVVNQMLNFMYTGTYDEVDLLTMHPKLYIIGDKYDIRGLGDLALQRFDMELRDRLAMANHAMRSSLIAAMQLAYEGIPHDRRFEDLALTYIVSHTSYLNPSDFLFRPQPNRTVTLEIPRAGILEHDIWIPLTCHSCASRLFRTYEDLSPPFSPVADSILALPDSPARRQEVEARLARWQNRPYLITCNDCSAATTNLAGREVKIRSVNVAGLSFRHCLNCESDSFMATKPMFRDSSDDHLTYRPYLPLPESLDLRCAYGCIIGFPHLPHVSEISVAP